MSEVQKLFSQKEFKTVSKFEEWKRRMLGTTKMIIDKEEGVWIKVVDYKKTRLVIAMGEID